MEDSVFTLKNYGKAELNLKKILDEKKISRNKLSTMIGANYDLITRYYQNSITRIDLDVISRICFVLNCDIKDLIVYKK